MNDEALFPVGEVARFAGVTVRTLHHYDEIGLLRPSGRSSAGYRQYGPADLARLQQILCYRELGFDLDKIAAILDDPGTGPVEHLRLQRERLVDRVERLEQLVAAVEKLMEARKMGIALTPDEMFEVFGDDDPTQYADAVEQRWGDTDAYRESQQQVARFTKDDWLRIKADGERTIARFRDAMRAGLPAHREAAMDAAEEHRRQIGNFYACSYDMHRSLGDMYLTDARFTQHYDRHAEGLAQYIRDAIHGNAERWS